MLLYTSLLSQKKKECKDVLTVISLVRSESYVKANYFVSKLKNESIKKLLRQYINYKTHNFSEDLYIIEKPTNFTSQYISNINQALFSFYKEGNGNGAIKKLNNNLGLLTEDKEKLFFSEIYKNILEIFDSFSSITNDKTHLLVLKKYKSYFSSELDDAYYNYIKYRLRQRFNEKEDFKFSIDSIYKLQQQVEKSNNCLLTGQYYSFRATLSFHYLNQKDSAIYFLNKSIEYFSKKERNIYKEKLLASKINLIAYNLKLNNISKARAKLNSIKICQEQNYIFDNLRGFYFLRKGEIFKIENSDSSWYYKAKYFKNVALQNQQSELYKIAELHTLEKEKENLQLKQDNLISESKRKQNANLFYGTLIFLVLGGVIALLTINNSKKKRQLAEQEKALEKQKNINLLKEQELKAINAMIDGQEKERKRIAEDLHDNIGSVLATLKLHFENLKLNREKKQFNQEELYKKTENLIDETYLKVRRIAHAKNAGVIANQGLLVAVKIMAEKISSADKINIEVIDYGLDSRLENSLEITVFRIIQELTTNIVKHAEAQNATINISQYDNILNIIVEDDGKGFDYKNTKIKDGIGLSSIKTRIEHLNGTFNVDSSLGNGTSIIIDIPIV